MQLRTMLATGLLCASVSSAHADTSFAAGSIIIPASAPYQTDCGAVSLYGFIYNVLRANEWLAANGHGTIEVYYAYKETKASPNRCTPTNLLAGPPYPGVPAPTHADPIWNDGCDFTVFSSNPATVPVKKIANTTAHTPLTDLASFTTSITNDAAHTSGGLATFPNWPSTTISAPATTTTRYWGGSFVVDDLDAAVLRRLISGNLIAQDAAIGGNNIDFAPFRTSGCTFGSTVGGQVNFHVAQVPFTAPTPKVLSTKPPRLALLARNANQTDGGADPNDGVTHPTTPGGNSYTGRVTDTILQAYLARAGLTFTGAQGCATAGYLASTFPALCPSPNANGQIFDLFDFRDLHDGKLADLDGLGNPKYKMLWMPHWEQKGGTTNAQEKTAIDNIATFTDGQAGLMAECAAIQALEGVQTGFVAPNTAYAPGQFQTCATAGCGATSFGLRKNTGGLISSDPTGVLRNCSDPTVTNGSDCTYFAVPGDSYIQIADYRWHASPFSIGSALADFIPSASSKYRPGVLTLVSGVTNLDRTKLATPALARTMVVGDFLTRSLKDNDPNKSNILYLGNHDHTLAVAGVKVVLQTLLQLGSPSPPPVTKEVTRSSPIVATITGEVDIVQGTFEKVTPPPPSKNATNDVDAPNMEFPVTLGHMRAIRASQISLGGTEFSTLGPAAVAFDAANGIPAANPAGCGGSNFAGTCRTVFTHTAAGVRPAREFFTTASAPLKSLVANGLTAANQNIVISRVLAGQPDGVGGYLSKLGGVDRSTVAVVGPSLLAGSATRPQMIYFGASDGMVHAVCAETVAATGCNAAGRELWAFIPRTQLPRLRTNTAVINGSPRFADLFGDFDPTDGVTTRTFRTVMLIPSGSGDPGVVGEQPSVTAIDVTDPFNPTILWEYVTPAARGITDFGQSIELTTGTVTVGAAQKVLAFVHSNNGGTGLAGSVVTAIDVETGLKFWQTGHEFGGLSGAASPAPRLGATAPVPAAGIPGAALAIDRTGAVAATDVVYATLYGDVWRLDAKTGVNAYGGSPGNPMFRFADDLKPIGATPAIFSDTPASPTSLFIAIVSGGYFDPAALSLWSGSQHHVVAFSVNTLAANIPLTELSGGLLKFKNDLAPGERGFAQPTVLGDQLFVTSDTTDVNSAAFGLATDTGHLYKMDLSNGGNFATTIINGGAGSIAHSGTTLYAASGSQIEEVGFAANTATTNQTSSYGTAAVARKMWLTSL